MFKSKKEKIFAEETDTIKEKREKPEKPIKPKKPAGSEKPPTDGGNWQRNKKAVAALLIVTAAVIGFVLMPMVNKQSNEQAEIVQAATEIPENTIITEDMISIIKIPSKMLPDTAVQDVNLVVGQYAQRRIEKQDYITTTKINTTPAMQEVNAIADKQIISLTIPTAAAGVSGILEIGDLVSVWSVPKDTSSSLFAQSTLYTSLGNEDAEASAEPTTEATGETTELAHEQDLDGNSSEPVAEQEVDATAPPETSLQDGQNPTDVNATSQLAPENILAEPEATLHEGLEYVEIAGVYSTTESNTDYVGPDIPVTISLYVTKEQAQKLVEVEHFKNLHLVFAARGENRVKYLGKEELIVW